MVVIDVGNDGTKDLHGGFSRGGRKQWDQLSDGKPFLTTTAFYNSGVSYLKMMQMSSAGGNASLILGQQLVAARHNTLDLPSGDPAVDAALAGAAAYCAAAPTGTPNPQGAERAQLTGWSQTLDQFNNGLLGRPHCS